MSILVAQSVWSAQGTCALPYNFFSCTKRTPEGSYSNVAQGSQCPVRALVNPGKDSQSNCTLEGGASIDCYY